jgi:hypothetical protein
MTPALASAIIIAVQELIKLSPALITEFQFIFSNPNPTVADWEALRAKISAKSYWDYVPASDLKKPAA